MSRPISGEKDWKGENDPRMRRKLQNRVNQRACRQRKREKLKRQPQVRRSARQMGVAPTDDASITVVNPAQDDQHEGVHPSHPSNMDDVHQLEQDDQRGPSQQYMSTHSPSDLLASETFHPVDFSFTTALTEDLPGNHLRSWPSWFTRKLSSEKQGSGWTLSCTGPPKRRARYQ